MLIPDEALGIPVQAFVLIAIAQYLLCALACMIIRYVQVTKDCIDLAGNQQMQDSNLKHSLMLGFVAGTLSVLGIVVVYAFGKVLSSK